MGLEGAGGAVISDADAADIWVDGIVNTGVSFALLLMRKNNCTSCLLIQE